MEVKKQHFIKSYQFWIAVFLFWLFTGGKADSHNIAETLTGAFTCFVMVLIFFTFIVFIKRKLFGSK